MHVASVQYDIVWEDKPANHAVVECMLADARLPRGTLVVLPEMGDTGFSFALDRIADDTTLPWARELSGRLGLVLQVGYAVRGADGRGRNCASIVTPDGEVLSTYQKVFPFSFGREIEHFSGGDHLVLAGIGSALVSSMVCYDLRFPELWRLAARHGATVMTIGANWPAARQEHWRSLLVARAIENQAFVVASNRTGHDPHLAYAGGSLILSPKGEIIAEAGAESAVLVAEIDPADACRWRERFPALHDLDDALLGSIRIERTGDAGAPQ